MLYIWLLTLTHLTLVCTLSNDSFYVYRSMLVYVSGLLWCCECKVQIGTYYLGGCKLKCYIEYGAIREYFWCTFLLHFGCMVPHLIA